MEVTFRAAVHDDLPQIVATYNSIVPLRTVTADTEPVSVESRRNWFDAHDPVKRPLWIVNADDKYAGWMSLSSFYGRPAYDGTAELSIYLDPAARGKGIGKQCMEKAVATAPTCGVHTLLGFIFECNANSLRLFERFEFESWARLPDVAVIDGKNLTLIIMGRKV